MNDGEPTTERLYAWLAVLPNEVVEGIVCAHLKDGVMPMMCTDRKTADLMRQAVEPMCANMGISAALVVFERGHTIDVIEKAT